MCVREKNGYEGLHEEMFPHRPDESTTHPLVLDNTGKTRNKQRLVVRQRLNHPLSEESGGIVEDEAAGGKGATKEGTEDIENKKFTAKAITIVARASDVDFVIFLLKDQYQTTQLKFKAEAKKAAESKKKLKDTKKEAPKLKRRKTVENKARLVEERKKAADLKKKSRLR
ncbi:hypothetical protein Bca52824_019533 [Brassica carinata]|uniref:Uncharacterized protein n=1 Tax=Brassica carinata TaxID=52824 RepID=A0A8X7VRQ6_BRACI|nr:hypothetical protein Bca52824_019533 [Brassica carinata]